MKRSSHAALVIALTIPACKNDAPPPPPPAAEPVNRAAAATTSPPPEVAGHPVCEVEISGTVRVPPKYAKAPPPMTFVALDDCLGPAPKMAGYGGSTDGKFFVEVFVPWGSDLTLCAASEPAPGKPSTLYGKAKIAMHAEGAGEVTFKDVTVDLEPGPPKTFVHQSSPSR